MKKTEIVSDGLWRTLANPTTMLRIELKAKHHVNADLILDFAVYCVARKFTFSSWQRSRKKRLMGIHSRPSMLPNLLMMR